MFKLLHSIYICILRLLSVYSITFESNHLSTNAYNICIYERSRRLKESTVTSDNSMEDKQMMNDHAHNMSYSF